MLYTPAQIKTLALLATNYVVEEGEAHPDAPTSRRTASAIHAYKYCSTEGILAGQLMQLRVDVFDAYTEAFEWQAEEGERWLEQCGYLPCTNFAAYAFRMITNPSTQHRAEDWTQ